ncbi:MAG: ATP-binding protein, partial [Clostridiales Family XIII bacterium]|nr:ATP-binding protein [Clostridiales Family XIII bacterium]
MTKILRNITKQLLIWRDKKDRMPLILHGARQVGKTFSAEAFGAEHYANSVTLNLEDSADVRAVFERDFDIARIIRELSALSGVRIGKGDTLIIFDEIQASERALLSLKYFYERASDYHIIATGSLLGIAVNRREYSFPVGKVEFLKMHPMDFEEFLSAKGEASLASLIRESAAESSPLSLHEKALSLYREYLAVGGMPKVVSDHIQSADGSGGLPALRALDTAYIADMAKYATPAETARIMSVYGSIPAQLARENNKFRYAAVKQGGKRSVFESAIDWLAAAGIGIKNTKVTAGISPSAAYEDDSFFKLYLHDCGLLTLKYGVGLPMVTAGAVQSRHVKGAMAENYVATALDALGRRSLYWSSGNTAEVDFVVQVGGGNVIPVEVKSADNTRSKSL